MCLRKYSLSLVYPHDSCHLYVTVLRRGDKVYQLGFGYPAKDIIKNRSLNKIVVYFSLGLRTMGSLRLRMGPRFSETWDFFSI